jgi:hypothetical protein
MAMQGGVHGDWTGIVVLATCGSVATHAWQGTHCKELLFLCTGVLLKSFHTSSRALRKVLWAIARP